MDLPPVVHCIPFCESSPLLFPRVCCVSPQPRVRLRPRLGFYEEDPMFVLLALLAFQAAQAPNTAAEAAVADPFADLAESAKPEAAHEQAERSWVQKFFTENFGFRKEIMSQFDTSERGQPASRQSVCF